MTQLIKRTSVFRWVFRFFLDKRASLLLGLLVATSSLVSAHAAGYTPQAGNVTSQVSGFEFNVLNPDSKYQYDCEVTSTLLEDQVFPWNKPRCSIDQKNKGIVDLLKPSQEVTVKITALAGVTEIGSTVLAGKALGMQPGLKPILGTPEVTHDGIKIPILNFNSSFTWEANNGFMQMLNPSYFSYWVDILDFKNVEFTTSKDGYESGKTILDLSSYKSLSPWNVIDSMSNAFDLVVTSHTDLGFVAEISNYDDTTTYTCETDDGSDCTVDENGNVYVTSKTPGQLVTLTVTATYNSGETSSSNVADASIPKSYFKPVFGALVSTKDGFKSKIKNFNGELIYDFSVSAGKVKSLDGGFFVVTGLGKGQQATVTVVTSCEDRDLGKGILKGKAASSVAPEVKKKN